MVEVIVLSDDEDEQNVPPQRTPPLGREMNLPPAQRSDLQKPKRPYKLVLVDSRRCSRMPRPRFLPITSTQDGSADTDSNVALLPEEGKRSAMEIDDDEEDPDYQDLRPTKRRRTGEKNAPKKHGKLSVPDWEIVTGREARLGQPETRNALPVWAVPDRKEAREYVKKLTAKVDWEGILRHMEKLRLSEVNEGQDGPSRPTANGKPRRNQNPANRLKQYWQGVMTKSILKMDSD